MFIPTKLASQRMYLYCIVEANEIENIHVHVHVYARWLFLAYQNEYGHTCMYLHGAV